MAKQSFKSEFASRAAFITGLAIVNPLLLTVYVLFYREGSGGAEFWAIGTAITLALCAIAAIIVYFQVLSDRKQRFKREAEAAKWRKIMPADGSAAEAG
jgi:ABC-type nickel/cobalt efflux system permease component RcnA